MLQFALYTAPGGALIADYSDRVQNLTITTNNRGFAEASGFIPLGLAQSFMLYDRAGLPHVVFSDSATNAVYEGRIEDVEIVTNGVKVRAFGYARALSDIPYTAMWSVSSLGKFQEEWLDGTVNGPTSNRFFDIKGENGVITVGMVKNSIITLNARGHMDYRIPNGSSRNVAGFMVDYDFKASANVTLRVSDWTTAYPFGGFTSNLSSLVGNGAQQVGSIFLGANTPIISFGLDVTTAHTYAGETGAEYVKFSNLRLVSLNAPVSTTLTAVRTNGSPVTCTVGSTAFMYIGQRLWFSGGGKTETAVVISIPSSTTFTANIVNAPGGGYPIGTTVGAWAIYADTIVSDILSSVRAVNPTQLASSTALIGSSGIDLLNETYEDQYPTDILDYLIGLGDTQSPPRQWEWGVLESRVLFFRPQSTANRTWYVDLSDIDVDRTLDQLHNSVYATYQDANGNALRTATNTDSASVTRYGLTRREALSVRTTNVNVAGVHRDAALQDSKDPPTRSSITLTRVYDATGARWPLWSVRAGDTLVIRNLPPTLSTTIDRIRSFRLTRAEYHTDDDTLAIEPDVPRPSLEVLLARLAIGLKP
jgi:hypothetical protein